MASSQCWKIAEHLREYCGLSHVDSQSRLGFAENVSVAPHSGEDGLQGDFYRRQLDVVEPYRSQLTDEGIEVIHSPFFFCAGLY